MAVERDSVPAQHHELCARLGQCEKKVAKVVREFDHPVRRGTNLQGICARVYVGRAWPARLKLAKVRR